MTKKRATIKDVAARAGVSVATASRALNNPEYPVGAAQRQRVREAARELDYIPNQAAQSLRRGQERDIGLVIPNISNQFYLQTILGINMIFAANKFSLLLCNTMRDIRREREFLEELFLRQVSGVILSSVDENSGAVKEYIRRGMKFVLLDQKLEGAGCPGIQYDAKAGAAMAVRYLSERGHDKIAFASLPRTRWVRRQIHLGYAEELRALGLAYDEALVYTAELEDDQELADPEVETGRRIAEAFLRDGLPATAVLCNNDMVAIGFIHTLLKNGVSVPGEISVVGFDDIPFAEAFYPPLTTVRYPSVETGRLAAMVLLDYIRNGQYGAALNMNLSPTLIERGTVRRL